MKRARDALLLAAVIGLLAGDTDARPRPRGFRSGWFGGNTAFVNSQSLDFDGINDYVTAVESAALRSLPGMTIVGWLKADTMAVNETIVSKWGNAPANNTFVVQTDSTSADELRIFIASSPTDAGSNYGVTTNANIASDRWTFVAVRYDGTQATNAAKLRVWRGDTTQGLTEVSMTYVGTIPSTTSAGTYAVEMGRAGALGRYFGPGNIDDVAIYTSALSVTNITSLYNSGCPGSQAVYGPEAWWRFEAADEATYPTVADAAGNGHTGTLTNMAASDFVADEPCGGDQEPLPTAFAVVLGGPSYFHLGGGTPQTAVWTDAGVNDAGTLLAMQVLDGSVVAAVDRGNAAAAIGAIQVAASSTGKPFILVDWEQPQTEPWLADMAAWQVNLTAAAEWARSNGYKLCPVGHFEATGCYYQESLGLPFEDGGTSYAPDAGSCREIHRDITNTLSAHLATMTDGGGVDPSCATLVFYQYDGPHSGTVDTSLVSGLYAADFVPKTTTSPLLSTVGWEVQADGLHFSQLGHRQAADALGRTWVRASNDTTATRFTPTGANVVDGETVDITFTVPCRTHGDCVDDPPLLTDTAGIVEQETQGGVATQGLHFWLGGSLQVPPNAVASVTPQTCTSPATSCTVRYVFTGGLPSFDELSFGGVYCKVFGNSDCSFGPGAIFSGGSNLVSRVSSACNTLPDGGANCYEQPAPYRMSVSYDAGVSVDAGFSASNLEYLAATSGNYVTVANQGGGSAQCVFAWGDLPTNNLDTIFVANASLRGFLGNIGGVWGCAISNTPGATYRVATGSYSTGARYDVACCYDGTSGPSGIQIYVGGTNVSGGTTGTGTAINADGVTNIPDNAASTDVDEVVVMPGKTSLSAGEILQLRCATKASTDSSPTAGECTGVVTDISAICALASGTRWYGFEGNATDRCGVLDGVEQGTPPYTSY